MDLRRFALLAACSSFALLVLLPISTSCTGGQTGDEDNMTDGTEFQGTQCPKFEDDNLVEGLSVAALSSAYDGLSCLAWDRQDDGALRLQFSNVDGPCLVEVDWRHRVTARDGALDLVASGEPECRIAGCGSCTYGFSYRLTPQPAGEPLRVTFALELCRELREPWLTATLPVDERADGIVCKQLSAGTQEWLHRCGAAHQPPCEGRCWSSDSGADQPCSNGLACDDANGVCLTPCESDADCPLHDVERCENGLCQVPATF